MAPYIVDSKLKHFCTSITMASVIQDIQHIHALRKNIRDITISPDMLKSIESIHHTIHSSSEQNGWKTVEWRGNGSSGGNRSHGNRQHGGNANRRNDHRGDRGADHRGDHRGADHRGDHRGDNRGDRGGDRNPQQKPDLFEPPTVRNQPVSADGFRPPFHAKYVSKFKKSSEKVEDTILNTILLGKLNKFSQPNYIEIKEFITHIIDSGQTDMIKCFMKLVFEKAASEEIFCPLYAKLLSELSTQYPVLLTEMENLYTAYMEIFEEVVESTEEDYNELCKRNILKKYRRGYSQFLAELIKYDVIDNNTLIKIVLKIVQQVEMNRAVKDFIKLNEEFADCLMKIMKAIQPTYTDDDTVEEVNDNMQVIREAMKEQVMERIQPLTVSKSESIGLSNKARFTFLDLYESIQRF